MIPCFILPVFSVSGQEIDEFAAENVRSVWFEKQGWRLAYPFASLRGDDSFIMHFDITGSEEGSLAYKIIHCDREWHRSDLFTSDYMDGFEENRIDDFQASFNTTVDYTHYRVVLPGEDIRFLISGNYMILIYRDGEEERPLLTRRFFITEGSAEASVVFTRPMIPGKSQTHQQSTVTVTTASLAVNDPYRDITVTILQNGRWDRAKMNLAPDFVENGRIILNQLSDKTLFAGGNEFRFFDIKTIRQKRQNVRDIVFMNGMYHVFLQPSEEREFKPYFSNEDINGRYIIASEESSNADIDGDYVMVYFTLPSDNELEGGEVHVAGAFTGWQINQSNKMTYNLSRRCYEASVMLKQGWYNYEFVFVSSGTGSAERYYFEGSHYETDNEYLILVYYRDPRQRYDRLTCLSVAGSRNR